MKTWWTAYCEAFAKCQKARNVGQQFISWRPESDGYRLIAHRNKPRWPYVALDNDIQGCAEELANRLAGRGLCEHQTVESTDE